MLAYRSLAKNAFDIAYTDNEQEAKNIFSKPTNDFLGKLSTINIGDSFSEISKIVDFIEKNVISGKIQAIVSLIPEYRYIADNSEKALPMYVSSGVVTEITPLILFFKYVTFNKMIIEEPEMCLHPKLQWALTRALIKATYIGKEFILTTHSEAIVQHINDMIKLNNHDDRKDLQVEFGYDDDDLISQDDVCVYQFIVGDDEKTTVEKLEYTENGFVVSSFIDNLRQRLRETRTFREQVSYGYNKREGQ